MRDLGVRWSRPYERVLDGSRGVPWPVWFPGGRLNFTDNCVDRHVDAGRGAKPAIVWEGDDGQSRTLTYACGLAHLAITVPLRKTSAGGRAEDANAHRARPSAAYRCNTYDVTSEHSSTISNLGFTHVISCMSSAVTPPPDRSWWWASRSGVWPTRAMR